MMMPWASLYHLSLYILTLEPPPLSISLYLLTLPPHSTSSLYLLTLEPPPLNSPEL